MATRIWTSPIVLSRLVAGPLGRFVVSAALVFLLVATWRSLGLVTRDLAIMPPGSPAGPLSVLKGVPVVSGVSLALALKWRWPAVLGILAGHLLGCGMLANGAELLVHALPPAIGAAGASLAMRRLRRKDPAPTFLARWTTLFLGGALGFAVIDLATRMGLAALLLDTPLPRPSGMMSLLTSDMLAILLVMAVFANLGELRLGRALWSQLGWLGGVAALVVVILFFVIRIAPPYQVSSIYLVFALPVALWIARQRYSLPGALVTAGANVVGLWLIAWQFGSVADPVFQHTQLNLLVLTISAQIFHMLERDRMTAAEEMARQRQALQDLLQLVSRGIETPGEAARDNADPSLDRVRQLVRRGAHLSEGIDDRAARAFYRRELRRLLSQEDAFGPDTKD